MIQSGMVSYYDALEPFLVDIDSVTPHPENYNNGDIEEIINSIETNGMYNLAKVQESTGYIAAGNGTWAACKELGATLFPVVRLPMDDMTTKRIMVADNWVAHLAKPDNSQLVKLLEEITEFDNLLGTGVKEHDLENLRLLAEIPLENDEYGTWPTLCFQISPATRKAFFEMTESAQGDRERFELLLKLAGRS
jgi:ParB-like chromosome segregation protein Spo0J